MASMKLEIVAPSKQHATWNTVAHAAGLRVVFQEEIDPCWSVRGWPLAACTMEPCDLGDASTMTKTSLVECVMCSMLMDLALASPGAQELADRAAVMESLTLPQGPKPHKPKRSKVPLEPKTMARR